MFHKLLNVAGETRSDARVASEGPRATVTGGVLSRKTPLPRRARACRSPCCGLPEARGGQAPALRYCDIFFTYGIIACIETGRARRLEKSRPGGLSYGETIEI